jgi:hypothetical protein
MPLVEALRAYVFAAERLHADDTTVPVLDIGKTRTGCASSTSGSRPTARQARLSPTA